MEGNGIDDSCILFEDYEAKATSRNRAVRLLRELRKVEEEKLRNGQLTKVKVLNGFALTTNPKKYEDYE